MMYIAVVMYRDKKTKDKKNIKELSKHLLSIISTEQPFSIFKIFKMSKRMLNTECLFNISRYSGSGYTNRL